MEPSGLAFGKPKDRLRAIRDGACERMGFPHYELNRFSERPVAEENKTLACPDKMRQPGIPT